VTPLAQAISGALVQFVWQGFLVSFLVSVAAFLLRKRGPNIRYFVYCAALFTLAVLPVVTVFALYDPFAGNTPGRAAMTLTIRGVWSGSAPAFSAFAERFPAASQPWILRIWMLGVAFLSARLAWLGLNVSSLRRSGGPANTLILSSANALARRMGMTRAVRILVSAVPDGPGVVGWFRPVILLPAATILNLTPDQLEAVLAHEIAHLRRYDDVVNIAQAVVETLLFYHPAVWWVSNRIRHEREMCCDDLAVRACGNAVCYARALTALERLRVSPPHLALGATGSPLEYRIRRIVGERSREYRAASLPGILALGLGLMCIAIYSNPAHGSAPEPGTHVEYPESARVNGIQGTVPVQVQVDNVGSVSDAKAIGGPKELRQAAVQSASALHFRPDAVAGTERVDVAFQLSTPAPVAPPAPVVVAQPRTGPRWRDRGESILGMAAGEEKDPAKKLELLKKWEQQYPDSEFRNQRTLMVANALGAIVGGTFAKTDTASLDAGRAAAQQLLDGYEEYFGDSLRPAGTTTDQWGQTRKNSALQIHMLLAYVAQTEKDYDTAEAELKKVLLVDPEQAATSYQLGATIVQEMATSNALTRYSEAIYDFARSLAVSGPTALPPEAKAAAENALKTNYWNYHGSTDGLDDLMKLVGASALPPADFHIVSVVELSEPMQKPQSEWGKEHPDLERWETAKTGLLEHGDVYFATVRDTVLSPVFRGTVVSQLSSNRILVNVDNVPAGDAVLRFDASHFGAVRPGTAIQFSGVVDSYTLDPYVLTFVIRNPKDDITGLNAAPKHSGNILARAFKGLFHLVRRLG